LPSSWGAVDMETVARKSVQVKRNERKKVHASSNFFWYRNEVLLTGAS
jgi:uncharacterized protein YcfL